MSAELLIRRKYFLGEDEDEDIDLPVRGFQHDLKAFFWVLVYICMSRGAPARRREELLQTHSNSTSNLRQQFRDLFEASGDSLLALTKQAVIENSKRFGTRVMKHITTYCQPLIPLVKAFYKALTGAYQSRQMDNLYDIVLRAFDDALDIDALADNSEHSRNYLWAAEDEVKRRHEDIPRHWDVDINSPQSKGTINQAPSAMGSEFQQSGSPPSAPPSPVPASRSSKRLKTEGKV